MALIGEVSVAITGDTSALQAATRKGSEEMRQFARDTLQSKRIIESLERPTETYARKLGELQRLQRAGHLTMEQYTDAQRKLKDELKKTQEKLEGTSTAAEGVTRNMGGGAMNALKSYAKAIGLIGTAAVGVREAILSMREEAERGITAIQGEFEADQRLLQISGGGTAEARAADAARRKQLAERVAQDIGIERTTAKNLLFAAGSTGFGGEQEFRQAARASQLLAPTGDVESVGLMAGVVRQRFGNAVGVNEALSIGLMASGGSAADFQRLVGVSGPASVGGAALGGRTREAMIDTFSMLAPLANILGDKEASQRIKAFGLRASRFEELQGRLPSEAVNILQKNPELRSEVLRDSQELAEFYQSATSKVVQQQSRELRESMTSDRGKFLLTGLEAQSLDPVFRARTEDVAARAARQGAAVGTGVDFLGSGAARNRFLASERARGRSPMAVGFMEQAMEAAESMGLTSATAQRRVGIAADVGGAFGAGGGGLIGLDRLVSKEDQAAADRQEQIRLQREANDLMRAEGEVVSFR